MKQQQEDREGREEGDKKQWRRADNEGKEEEEPKEGRRVTKAAKVPLAGLGWCGRLVYPCENTEPLRSLWANLANLCIHVRFDFGDDVPGRVPSDGTGSGPGPNPDPARPLPTPQGTQATAPPPPADTVDQSPSVGHGAPLPPGWCLRPEVGAFCSLCRRYIIFFTYYRNLWHIFA